MRNIKSKPVINIHNLGEVASQVMALNDSFNQQASDIDDDLRAFGAPSECWGDAFNGFGERLTRETISLLLCYDLTIEEYNAELKKRCCGKFLHFHDVYAYDYGIDDDTEQNY